MSNDILTWQGGINVLFMGPSRQGCTAASLEVQKNAIGRISERGFASGTNKMNERIFIGKEGKYQIPNGAIVVLKKCYSKRKCIVEYDHKEFITLVSLLRRLKTQ